MNTLFRYLIFVAAGLTLQACGGSGGSGGGGGSSPPPPPPPVTQQQAARFLAQATFGPTTAEIDQVVALNDYEAWLEQQFAIPHDPHLPYVIERDEEYRTANMDATPIRAETGNNRFRHQAWWNSIITGTGQLRHRVAYALSQILVVSDLDPNLSGRQFGVTDYYDMLARNAFGNYRDLLLEVSLHPAMGYYLSSLGNRKAAGNVRPDENYAREIMQLFALGVFELNNDGTLKTDTNGDPIPNYTEDDIKEFAEVFTGWNRNTGETYYSTVPMIANESLHDTSTKILLNGTVLPAGQTAQMDMEGAIDNLFNHPNIAPFISQQLIQRLVTSNPTPSYVNRVANAFNDNGSGVKGDLKAVVTAILLDTEARDGHETVTDFGKLREPLLRISHLWRTLKAIPIMTGEYKKATDTPYYTMPYSTHPDFISNYGQSLLRAPSVFNFYRPDYSPQDLNLVAPEFQIATENTIVNLLNSLNRQIQNAFNDTFKVSYTTPDLTEELALIPDTAGLTPELILDPLLNHLDLLLLNGQMTDALRATLVTYLGGFDNTNADHRTVMVRDAITLIISSPEYLIQK